MPTDKDHSPICPWWDDKMCNCGVRPSHEPRNKPMSTREQRDRAKALMEVGSNRYERTLALVVAADALREAMTSFRFTGKGTLVSWEKLGETELRDARAAYDALVESEREHWPECSVCRRRHPSDDRHPCE